MALTGLLVVITAADPSRGDFLASSALTDEVLRYRDGGSFVGPFVSAGSGGLNAPASMAWGSDGDLYVGTADGKIFAYDGATGAFRRSVLDRSGWQWWGLAFAPDGTLLANEVVTDGVYRIDPDSGAIVASIGVGALPNPIKIIVAAGSGGGTRVPGVPDRALVGCSDPSQHTVYAIDLATNSLIGPFASDPRMGAPSGLEYGPDGSLYVTDFSGPQGVTRVNPVTGAFIDQFVPQQYGGVSDALFTPAGKMFVGNLLGGGLTRYNATTGELETEISTSGAGLWDLLYMPEPGGPCAVMLMLAQLCVRQRNCLSGSLRK
jgi:outer membrane protein assembly factor BamB